MNGTLADLLGEGSTASLPSDKPTHVGRPKAAKKSKSAKRKGSLPDKRLNMEVYLSDYGQVFREKWEGSKDRMLYHLEHCPVHTDPDGDTYECCVMQYGSGKLGAHCKHSTDYHWQDFKEAIGQPQETHWEHSDRPDDDDDEQAEKKESRVAAIIKQIASKLELFSDELNETYVRVDYGDHKKIHRLESKRLALFIIKSVYDTDHSVPNQATIDSVVKLLSCKALFEGPKHQLYNRAARSGDAIFYDMADEKGRAIKIDIDGWSIAPTPPILFRNYTHQASQIEPKPGGNPWLLFEFIRIADEGTQLLLLTWIAACFLPEIPHPIVILHGVQGSGKSLASRHLRSLTDPSVVASLSLPRDVEQMIQMLDHHWQLPFDNIDKLTSEQSDTLCRAVTGDGHSRRALYTNDEVTLRSYRRCIVLNGINNPAFKPDILDRSIMIELDRIPNTERKEESRLNAEWAAARPQILGGILDALLQAISIYPNIQCSELPRMADFARWGCAIAQGLGRSQDDFLKAMFGNIQIQNEEALSNHPVATAILELMETMEEWEGSATELLKTLEQQAGANNVDVTAKSWPKTPQILSRRINEVAPNLQEAGVSFTRIKEKSRTLKFGKIPSLSSVAPETLQGNNLHNYDTAGSIAQRGDLPSSRDLFGAENTTNEDYTDATGDDTTVSIQIPSTPKSNINNSADDKDDKDDKKPKEPEDGIFAEADSTSKQDNSSPTSPIDNDDEPWIVI